MPLPAATTTAPCQHVRQSLCPITTEERPRQVSSLYTRSPKRCHLCGLEQPLSLAVGQLMSPNADSIALGAHRGMGMNVVEEGEAPWWRENTIKSFMKAADLGASFIEFDVQVTKDGVPIVWHDDWITYGTSHLQHSSKIRDLTFAEFRSIGRQKLQLYRGMGTDVKEWRCLDEDELPSLAQVFQFMPEHVAFNIEIKTTSDPHQEALPDDEIQFVTGAVVSIVERLANDRTIVFSSFDPDLTHQLKKAQRHATMFLSSGEGEVHVDPRRTSYASAVEWALSSGLDGIVLHSNDLRQRQDLISQASAQGLLVMTFGSDNDDHEWILAQFCLGVHGAIVDDVTGVTQKLSGGILDFI